LPSYYHDFETGGILRIGAVPGAQAGGDDDDDEEVSALEEEDDEETSGPVTVTFNTGPDTFVNGGTIAMMNGIVGDTLVINDHYDSQDGNLAIDTELGNSASPTDNLTINGPVTGTTTTVYVNNVGGKGAFTGQGKSDGIEIATSGTDAFAPDSFTLATNALTGRKEVLAGAFAYRLAVTDDAALLQSDILDQVPAYVTAPSVAQRFVSSGLDTLYKRLGEIRNGYNGGATSANGHIWVRGNYSDYDVDPKEGFSFEQKNRSVLAGGGVTVAADGASRLDVGVFGGYGTADADVKAVIFGASSESSIDVKGWTGGGYVTYYELGRTGTGLYIDGVFKADSVDFDMAANSRAAGGSTSGDSFTTSGEIGYGFGIGGGMVIQPQAQLAYTDLTVDSFKDSAPYGLGVSYGVTESLIGRIGVQLQANLVQPGGGTISPYAIFNVLSEFEGNNKTTVAATDFRSDVSGTWYSAGGGVTAQFAENVSLYGSGEYSFGDVEGWQGTGGVKVNW
jgi:outer membrane autotransporter protein